MNNPTVHSGKHDFDFLFGTWTITNRRLRQRLQACTEWETFEASQTISALPGGIGNYDDFIASEWRPNLVGMSLRLFNPVTKLWSIYWLDNDSGGLNLHGNLNPPVVGQFSNGTGIFEGADMLGDQAILVRYTWSNIKPDSAHWEQAMSNDNGKTWETNWHMDMRKVN